VNFYKVVCSLGSATSWLCLLFLEGEEPEEGAEEEEPEGEDDEGEVELKATSSASVMWQLKVASVCLPTQ